MNSASKKSGFTLIEIFLSISVIAIILAISAPVYSQFLKRNDLSLSSEAVLGNLRRAYFLSVSSVEDDSWGVYIDNGGVTIFKGNNFSTRDTDFDETENFAPNLSASGPQEIIFSKVSGVPSVDGTITITSNLGFSRDITINEEGSVYMQ